MGRITLAEWRKEGLERFGDRWSLWKFKCVRCGHIQTGIDFKELALSPEEIERVVFFSCIGRMKKGIGCDWTLGGLLTIHSVEVIDPDGKVTPVFEFA